jgi:hypothetical protein
MLTSAPINLRLPHELVVRLEREARDLGLSKSEAARAAIVRGLEERSLDQRLSAIEQQLSEFRDALAALIQQLAAQGQVKIGD